MVSQLKTFDLDTSSPRGWCKLGQPGDATEHGHRINNEDIKRLKEHYGLQISEHVINNNRYTLFSLLNEGATDTVVSILGGDGKYYIIDSNILPDGMIMPFFEHCKTKKLNLIIIDPEYALEHAWNSFLIRPPLLTTKYQQYINSKIPLVKHLILNKFNKESLLSKFPWYKEVKNFTTDLETILKYIQELTHTDLWLMGHCSGSSMIALLYDLNHYNNLYKGIILLNPFWKQQWEENLSEMNYFNTTMDKPLLVIQHRNDHTLGANIHIAKKIIEDATTIRATCVELSGGTDQGSATFSMGYHGFRDIEHNVIDEIDRFIRDQIN